MVRSASTGIGEGAAFDVARTVDEGRSNLVHVALNLATIIVAIVLMVTILLQSKTSAFGGGMGGDSGSIVKTRRGFEQTLFQFTVGTAVVFVVLCVLSGLLL
jgi:protein translocase SecG subunit